MIILVEDNIDVRMSAIDENIWPLPSVTKKLSANPKDRIGFTSNISRLQTYIK